MHRIPLPEKMASVFLNNIVLVFLSSHQARRLFSGITRVWSTVRWASCHSTTSTKVKALEMTLKIQTYMFEIVILGAGGDVKSVHNHRLHVSQKDHLTQPESKGKSSHRLHLSHQNNRPGFPEWALRPTQLPSSTVRLVTGQSVAGWKRMTQACCESDTSFTDTPHACTGYKYRFIPPRWWGKAIYVLL